MHRRPRLLALGAAGLLAVAGGGAAYASTSSGAGDTQARHAAPPDAPGYGGPGPDGFRGGHRGGPLMLGLDSAADYLGLSPAQLRQRLAKGNSLADVAKAQGKTVDGLEQALLDAARTRLDKAVGDGRLTSAQRDQLLKDVQQHVADLVQGKGPGPGGRMGRRGGRCPGMGAPPSGSSGSQQGSSYQQAAPSGSST